MTVFNDFEDLVKDITDLPGDLVEAAKSLFEGAGGLAGVVVSGAGLFIYGPGALIPVLVAGAGVTVGVNALIKQRTMSSDERRLAESIFGGTLPPFDKIILTNLSGLEGRAFTVPNFAGQCLLNLGDGYDDPIHWHPGSYSKDGQVLIHELTHAWQIQHSSFAPGLVCQAISNQAQNSLIGDVYNPGPGGKDWSDYNLEQQATIVDRWFHDGSDPNSPFFRYIENDIRAGESDASSRWTPALVSAVSSVPGGVSLFAVGFDGAIWSSYFDPRQANAKWVDWHALSEPGTTPVGENVSAVSSVAGGVSLFAVRTDGAIWSSYFDPRQADAKWVDWYRLSEPRTTPAGASVSAVSSVPGGVSLFVVGTDGAIWSSYFDPRQSDAKWADWHSLSKPGTAPVGANVSAVSSVPGGVSLFVVDTHGAIWSSYFDPRQANAKWVDWYPLSKPNMFPLGANISAVSSVPGGISLFGVGLDGGIWSSYFDPRQADAKWVDLYRLGKAGMASADTSVGAVSSVQGGVSLFVVDTHGAISSTYFDPRQGNAKWVDWFALSKPGTAPVNASITAVSSVPGGVSLFAPAPDRAVLSSYFDPRQSDAKWADWHSLSARNTVSMAFRRDL